MLIGSLAMAFGDAWHWQIAGRLVSGAGGVLLTVQLTKMVTDWFAGKEIATAMGAVRQFLAGRRRALAGDLAVDRHRLGRESRVLCGLGRWSRSQSCWLLAYQTPPAAAASAAASQRLDRQDDRRLERGRPDLGLVQCRIRYRLQLRTDHAGRARLVDRAGRLGDLDRVVIAVFSVPFGGFVADRFKHPQTMLVVASFLFAGLMLVLAHSSRRHRRRDRDRYRSAASRRGRS